MHDGACFVDLRVIYGQEVTSICNYSTPYRIPEFSPITYYLYDGIEFTINTHFERTAAVNLNDVQITRLAPHADTALFQGFYVDGTVPVCLNTWLNRCTHTFDQDASCDPCEYSVTVSGYDSSTDDNVYVSNVATSNGTVPCIVPLPGKNN